MNEDINYVKLFSINECLIPLHPIINDIHNLKEEIEILIKGHKQIPKELIEKHAKLSGEFSRKFFEAKMIECLRKHKGVSSRILNDMKNTKKQVISYKKKLNDLPNIIKMFKKNAVTSYEEFLNLSEKICDNFIMKHTKHFPANSKKNNRKIIS